MWIYRDSNLCSNLEKLKDVIFFVFNETFSSPSVCYCTRNWKKQVLFSLQTFFLIKTSLIPDKVRFCVLHVLYFTTTAISLCIVIYKLYKKQQLQDYSHLQVLISYYSWLGPLIKVLLVDNNDVDADRENICFSLQEFITNDSWGRGSE